MIDSKLISFVLPAYKATFFQQAIASILAQTYTNFELIIVDDQSPEDLQAIVNIFDDSRIRYYKNEKNIGGNNLVAQWNHSITFAKGEYLVLAADDDLYHPNFLKTCVDLAIKYPDVDIVRSRVEQIDEENGLLGIDGILPEFCSKYAFLKYWLDATAFTCIGNFLFRTSVIQAKKFIDFPFAFGSDTATAIMMAENGIANTAEMLFSFRISSVHLSSNKGKLMEKLEANTLLFKWLKNLNYEIPFNKYDLLDYQQTQWANLYAKCKYDYYNLVIRHFSFRQLFVVNRCVLLSSKDRLIMKIRFIVDKIFRR
ncbi:glycosyltransferase family 2 protein [Sphingobacterium sp. LRF_L2]|uniref:glycosyltransferase family 2 protein n=1 Tax=Sphingobacterium sp. LRF_L2 TaxID=3369421 RepID=UPI003F6104D4